MSKTKVQLTERQKQRAYALNVAQQFLQSLPSHSCRNPLIDLEAFIDSGGSNCGSVGNAVGFYKYYDARILDFLLIEPKFSLEKLARLFVAGLGFDEAQHYPKKTGLIEILGNKSIDIQDKSGPGIQLCFVVVVIAAAAFDLCYTKHLQGGIRPL